MGLIKTAQLIWLITKFGAASGELSSKVMNHRIKRESEKMFGKKIKINKCPFDDFDINK